MTEWQIRLPHRDPDESVVSIADAAAEMLDGEEAMVARQIAFDALARGTTRTGDLLREFEAAGVDGRRQLVNHARQQAGLPTLEGAQAERELNAWLSAPTTRDMYGRVEHRCHESGCNVIEPDERLGPGSVKWTKINGPWYCQRHRPGHEEAFEPWTGARRILDPNTGLVVNLDEQERERERAEREAAARQKQHERRLAERRADAEKYAELEAADRDRFRAELATNRKQP